MRSTSKEISDYLEYRNFLAGVDLWGQECWLSATNEHFNRATWYPNIYDPNNDGLLYSSAVARRCEEIIAERILLGAYPL